MVALALIRHAKSDWGSPDLDDHDRPLNDRGSRDAPVMAERLAARGFVPDRILASTALRARTTAEWFARGFGLAVDTDEALYGAPARTILAAAAASGVESVAIVAHDPGMSVAVDELSGGEWAHMPTCAVAVFRWDTPDWQVALSTPPDARSFDAPR